MPDHLFEIRSSQISGQGAFAIRRIRKGSRIIEYLGERISQDEADRRYDDTLMEHPRVLLFTVDNRTVIDAAVNGNEAQYINHSCEPNCHAVTKRGRVHIWALRDILPGEELTYDYTLTREGIGDDEAYSRYACHCGAHSCRGTMLAPK